MLEKVKQAMAALSPEYMNNVEYAAKGYHLDVKVAPEQVVEAATILDKEKFTLEAVTGVDWLGEKEAELKAAQLAAKKAAEAAAKEAAAKAEESGEAAAPVADEPPAEEPAEPAEDELEVVYDYSHVDALCRVVVRARMPRSNPAVPTISKVYPGANWHERETHDFFGIYFEGHPNLCPLLLPEDADFHPLLKDFKA